MHDKNKFGNYFKTVFKGLQAKKFEHKHTCIVISRLVGLIITYIYNVISKWWE
jgi:hypothetical protein